MVLRRKRLEIVVRHLHVYVMRKMPRKMIGRYKWRAHDVGRPTHTKRVTFYNPRTKRWRTYKWMFLLEDVKARRPVTMRMLRELGVLRRALELVG